MITWIKKNTGCGWAWFNNDMTFCIEKTHIGYTASKRLKASDESRTIHQWVAFGNYKTIQEAQFACE